MATEIMPKKENRGGKRQGSGRKAIYTFSEPERKRIIRAFRRAEKNQGVTVGERLAQLALNEDDQAAAKGLQIYFRDVLPHQSERDVNHHIPQAPAIYLPEQDKKPCEVIPIGGKK